MTNKLINRTELTWKKESRWNRDHRENMRSVLRALAESTEPMAYSKILYICRTTNLQAPVIFADLASVGLIKVVKEKKQKSGVRRQLVITKKGQRLLHLMDKQAQLIPSAGWLLENTQ